MDVYKLKEVFSRGMPTVTYVGRQQLGLEKQLRGAVSRGYAIIAVTGPSKCGKTVLRRTVIPDNVVAHIEGGQVGSESDFWDIIRAHLEAPTSQSKVAAKQVGSSGVSSLSVGPSFAKASLQAGESNASSRTDTQTFSGPQKGQLLRSLLQTNDVLVVDDFHYIGTATRAQIVRSLKSSVFDGLTVVMLSVPYRAFDVLSAEAEMEGRFTHLQIPTWSREDLIRISQQGFPALGLNVAADIQDRFASESLGSPLLMQSLCAQLCSELDVFETLDQVRRVNAIDVDIEGLFRSVATDFGLPAFKKLSTGPQTRTDRNPRKFVNGQTGDIYEAVLAAVAYAKAGETITYDELRSALRDILAETPPQKHEVTRAIQQMCGIAKKMRMVREQQQNAIDADEVETSLDIPAIDWQDDALQMNDVFLRFYLRWIHRQTITSPNGQHCKG